MEINKKATPNALAGAILGFALGVDELPPDELIASTGADIDKFKKEHKRMK